MLSSLVLRIYALTQTTHTHCRTLFFLSLFLSLSLRHVLSRWCSSAGHYRCRLHHTPAVSSGHCLSDCDIVRHGHRYYATAPSLRFLFLVSCFVFLLLVSCFLFVFLLFVSCFFILVSCFVSCFCYLFLVSCFVLYWIACYPACYASWSCKLFAVFAVAVR